MTNYKNLFEKLTREELRTVYKQYREWCEEGFISDDAAELGKIRNEYHELFGAHTLTMLERDLLRAIAERWYRED